MARNDVENHHRRRRRRDHHHRGEEVRLKCIVLGSAAAGKTSLIRRYVHGTFAGCATGGGDGGGQGLGGGRNNDDRRESRTRGADYYVRRVSYPIVRSGRTDDDGDDASESHPPSHVLVQLWDTVGRETLRPRRHASVYDSKSNFYQFLSIRHSSSSRNTANCSHYEHRYNNWGFQNGPRPMTSTRDRNDADCHRGANRCGRMRRNDDADRNVVRHVDDTVERSRRLDDVNEPIGDALFRNIDACMLVYDAT